ncbi:MAG: hypothetical protein OEW77_11130 [Gemmatimonadota bacterium]|nr:hypothetical protein [Gemmatimonadota bacterium]
MRSDPRRLHQVKLLHTVAWALLGGCVLAIPVAAWAQRYDVALLLIIIVGIESVVLAVNDWKCPLTAVAARYTDEREDNFDIYLPLLLARWNKHIFGPLFVAGILFTLARWRGWLG